jgi:L-threonylcarbamoyladenylate synthase
MEPNILRMPDAPPDPELLARVTQHLEGGGLVAMPTETVYGFGSALQEEPLLRLARMKARSTEKPFLVLVPGVNSVRDLHWPPKALALAEVFWPGALTLVLRDEGGLFPPGVRSPGGSVAIRQSPHPLARAVVGDGSRPRGGGRVVGAGRRHPGPLGSVHNRRLYRGGARCAPDRIHPCEQDSVCPAGSSRTPLT